MDSPNEQAPSNVNAESRKPIANFVVRPNEQKRSQKFDFMPHFEEDFYEFMIPEGTNSVESVMAVLTFYGHLNGPMPNFSIVSDKLNLFAIGDVSTLQEANYIQSSIPILLKQGAAVKAEEIPSNMYQFSVEAVQGLLKSECIVKVEVGKFQPPAPINNTELEQAQTLQPDNQEDIADTTALLQSETTDTSNSSSLADLVLGNGFLAAQQLETSTSPYVSATILSTEEKEQSVMEEDMVSGAEMPEEMADPLLLEQEETSTLTALMELESLATEEIDLTQQLDNSEKKESQVDEEINMSVTDLPTEQVVEGVDEGNKLDLKEDSTLIEESVTDATPLNTLVNETTNAEMHIEMATDTTDASSTELLNVENTTIEVDKKEKAGIQTQKAHKKGIELQLNGIPNDMMVIEVPESIRSGDFLPQLSIRAIANSKETIDEIIQLKIEPSNILDVKPHFVLPGQIARLFVVDASLLANYKGEAVPKITIKANFANKEIQSQNNSEEQKELKLKKALSQTIAKVETEFESAEYEFQISELAVAGSEVGQVQVSDKQPRKYSLLGQGNKNFQISETGIISLVCQSNISCLDRESKEVFYLVVIAADLGEVSSVSPAPITIHVLDENDNGPIIQTFDKELNIINGEISDPFLISVVDFDSVQHQNNKLDLLGAIADNFVLEKLSDSLFQLKLASFLERGEYSVQIVATDVEGKNPPRNSVVQVVVTGKSQTAVHFKRNLYEKLLISDKLHKGYPIAQLELEGIPIDAISFVILENPGWLAIESFGGNVFVGDVPRSNIKTGRYTATVGAVDRESQKILAKCKIAVNVMGSSQEEASFLEPLYSFNISKDEFLKGNFYKLSLLEYMLENTHIEVVQEETKAWDLNGFETKFENISSMLNVSNNNLLMDLKKLTNIRLIHLHLSNEKNKKDQTLVSISFNSDPQKELTKLYRLSKPKFVKPWVSDEKVINLKVLEELPVGYLLLRLPAFNSLSAKAVENYTLTGDAAKYFRFDHQTASILLDKQIDFEELADKVLRFELNAFTDNQQQSTMQNREHIQKSTAKLEVEVLDIDDNSPKLKLLGPTNVEIAENSKPGTTVAQFSCVDTDSKKLHLQLTGKETSHFRILQKNDVYFIVLSSTADLDREKMEKILLLVSCIDPVGNQDQLPVEIKLLDENDNRPLFTNPSISDVKAYDNWVAEVPIMQFQAEDKDLDDNARVIYSVQKGTDSEKHFSVDSKTGLLSTKTSLQGLASSKPYVVTVFASDSEKSPKFSSTSTLLVYVHDASSSSDFNDEKSIRIVHPEIDFVLQLPEDEPVGRKVYDVVASIGMQEDSHKNSIEYELEAIDRSDEGWLRIDKTSGEIFVLASLDYETQKYITVKIIAKSDLAKNKITTRLLRVKVLNVDDHKPVFLQKTQGKAILICEDSEQSAAQKEEDYVGQVFAVDEDAEEPFNKTYYYLFPQCSNQQGKYRIEKNTGKIFKSHSQSDQLTTDPVNLCAYTSSSNDLDPSNRIAVNNSESNQLAITVYSQKQLDALELDEQSQWQSVYFQNNSIVNLEPDMISATVPFHLNEPLNTHFYSLSSVNFAPLSPKGQKTVELSPALTDLIGVDAESGDLVLDPMLPSMDQGIYSVGINVVNDKQKEQKIVKKINKQIHLLSNENRLKFVFDESVNALAVSLASFKSQLENFLSSLPNQHQIQVILSQLQIHSLNRSSVCFHLANSSQQTDEIVELNESMKLVSTTPNFNRILDNLYRAFKVINIENCLTVEHTSLTDSLDASTFNHFKLTKQLMFWIVLVAIGILILVALCGYLCFVTRYRDYLKKRTKKQDQYFSNKEKLVKEYSPFSTPQFLDARKITSPYQY